MSHCENYLRDVLSSLLENAMEAKADYAAKRTLGGDGAAQFEAGHALAYYEVISLLVKELDKFAIPRADVGLDPGLDVDAQLL